MWLEAPLASSSVTNKADIGLVGLAVMGQNLALNLNDHGYRVAVFNRTTSKVDEFLADLASDALVIGTDSLEALVESLAGPRRVMLMVRAGAAVDSVIEGLIPLLQPGDIIIDGGNSHYSDTVRRTAELESHGLLFVGMGISGGEEGARYGPSIMPGGSPEAWPHIKEMFQDIAAKVADGTPCCDWVGPNGAGHFVKMVHNGIEYGDMQVIAEAYDLLMNRMGLSHEAMADVYQEWGEGRLDSYLIDITSEILRFPDEDGQPLVTRILDAAAQKGTGRWAVESSLEAGTPLNLVAEAVYARTVSSLKEQRVAAAGHLPSPDGGPAEITTASIHDALYASKIVSYAQGFMLLRAASEDFEWNLDLGRIALLWREGCIIRAAFLEDITAAYRRDPDLPNLLLDPFFVEQVSNAQHGWRAVISDAVTTGLPVPAYSSALAFYDSYRADQLPANLIQAQRDFFGAHTYERIDASRGEFFHTNWTGRGGETTAGSYEA